jgi:hypothetical protein
LRKLTFTKAFAKYGAKLTNTRWAYSAIAEDGSLVFSCWEHLLKPEPRGVLRYEDRLSRWSKNRLGKKLLRDHLKHAFDNDLPVRLVIASAKNLAPSVAGKKADSVEKTFYTQDDVVGKVIVFDGDNFVIDYEKTS